MFLSQNIRSATVTNFYFKDFQLQEQSLQTFFPVKVHLQKSSTENTLSHAIIHRLLRILQYVFPEQTKQSQKKRNKKHKIHFLSILISALIPFKSVFFLLLLCHKIKLFVSEVAFLFSNNTLFPLSSF